MLLLNIIFKVQQHRWHLYWRINSFCAAILYNFQSESRWLTECRPNSYFAYFGQPGWKFILELLTKSSFCQRGVNHCMLVSSHVGRYDIPFELFYFKSNYFLLIWPISVPSFHRVSLPCNSVLYLNWTFLWNKHELIQVVVTANVTIQKKLVPTKNIGMKWNAKILQWNNKSGS